MLKIGTHNSATGEKGGNFLSYLIAPFAKTQSKTIKQQFDAGCRSFDIRVKLTENGWYCAHGLWTSKKDAFTILKELNNLPEIVQVDLTYEGDCKGLEAKFAAFVHYAKRTFKYIIWGNIAYKYDGKSKGVKVNYKIIEKADSNHIGGRQGFIPLDGSTWHTYIPIPWLWNKIYTRKHSYRKDIYTFVDFL